MMLRRINNVPVFRLDKSFDVLSVEEWTLSKQNEKDKLSSVVTTTQEAGTATETSLEALTPREEKVIRMLHELSEDDSRSLEFALGASEDSLMKLALIERQLVNVVSNPGPADDFDDDRPSPAELLSSWIDEN